MDDRIREIANVVQRLSEPIQSLFEPLVLQQALNAGVYGEQEALFRGALTARIRLASIRVTSKEVIRLVGEGMPVAWKAENPNAGLRWYVFQRRVGSLTEAVLIHGDRTETIRLSDRTLAKLFRSNGPSDIQECYCAESLLACDDAMLGQSLHPPKDHGAHHHHAHHSLSPMKRLLGLLRLDWGDIVALFVFGFTAGVLGLASPLAVEWVVTTIGFGRYLQPVVVLSVLLLTFLSFAGAMRVLQSVVVEVMQRRMMVRFVGDLSFRLPHSKRDGLDGEHASELLNRFLDVPTIQKSVATLLLDGLAIMLSTIIGMILLAFYHPFLLGFDIVLLLCMTIITYVLGRGAVRTAIQESIIKYRITHWLQDVISNPTTFRLNGGSLLAMERSNQLTVEYLDARKRHFSRLLRQLIFAVALQALASTALLGIGGWLVIDGQLTLGQLVASELVVTVIIGAFAKVGKSLEIFYDLLAAIDKVGHIFDLPIDPPTRPIQLGSTASTIRWHSLSYSPPLTHHPFEFGSGLIEGGKHVVIDSEESAATSYFLEILSGLREPSNGFAELLGIDSRESIRVSDGTLAALMAQPEIFHGSVIDNLSLRRPTASLEEIRKAIKQVGLLDDLLELPDGLETPLQTGGFPLSREQCIQLMVARVLIAKPRILLIDRILDSLPRTRKMMIKEALCDPSQSWTLVVVTNDAAFFPNFERLTFPSESP